MGTPLIEGPWNPRHANGSSALALLCHCLGTVPTLTEMSLARFTVDLMRPVPVGAPLTVSTRVAREGKKLQIVELEFTAPNAQGQFSEEMIVKIKDREDTLRFTVIGRIN